MNKLKGTGCAKFFAAAVAVGGVPLITFVSCDSLTGAFDFYRDDDFDDGYYYDDYYYDDCFDCYYEDDFFFFP